MTVVRGPRVPVGESVEVVPASQLKRAVEALREIANGEWAGWSSGQPKHIAREALDAMGVDLAAERGR